MWETWCKTKLSTFISISIIFCSNFCHLQWVYFKLLFTSFYFRYASHNILYFSTYNYLPSFFLYMPLISCFLISVFQAFILKCFPPMTFFFFIFPLFFQIISHHFCIVSRCSTFLTFLHFKGLFSKIFFWKYCAFLKKSIILILLYVYTIFIFKANILRK